MVETSAASRDSDLIGRDEVVWVTWETALWAGVLALALVLRMASLGAMPLSVDEARNALSAWDVYRGTPTVMPQGALLTQATALVFFMFGASDASARLLPALAGSLLVVWPLFLRDQLGRLPSLVAAGLLAISPSLVAYSRRVDSATLVACLALLLVVALVRWRESARREWLIVAAGSAGALVVAGPVAYTCLIALAIAAAVYWWSRRKDVATALGGGAISVATDSGALTPRGYTVIAAVASIAIATGLLSYLPGVQSGIVDAVASWGRGASGTSLIARGSTVLQHLGAYEPLICLLGLAGAAWLTRVSKNWLGIMLWWALALIVLAAVIGPTSAVALALVPLALTGGVIAVRVADNIRRAENRRAIAVFACVVLGLLWLVLFGQVYFSRPDPVVPSTVGLLPVALLFLAIGLFWFQWGWQRVRVAGSVVGLVLVVIMAFHVVALPSPAPWGSDGDQTVTPDVRTLVEEVGATSDALAMKKRDGNVRIASSLRVPLAWYFRNLPVEFSDTSSSRDAIVVDVRNAPVPGWSSVGRYYLLSRATAVDAGWGKWWLWYFYRESRVPADPTEVTVYIRT